MINLTITDKELKATEAIKNYIEEKLTRIEKYFGEEEVLANVKLKAEKNYQIAEMYVSASGSTFKAVTEDKDLYASIDKDIDILEGQIRKAKTRKEKMQKDNSIKQITISGEEESTVDDEVIKTLHYEIKPMSLEDAKIVLKEKQNNLFLPFVDSASGKVCVIYKLNDGKNFGIVEPEA
ncbi:MAG: ribosome-associated translation inhibitor RaiA [Clostridia bacterium]|nr:ribosome-associated translation inhibitor RaiA [Clostridia bacterium]